MDISSSGDTFSAPLSCGAGGTSDEEEFHRAWKIDGYEKRVEAEMAEEMDGVGTAHRDRDAVLDTNAVVEKDEDEARSRDEARRIQCL